MELKVWNFDAIRRTAWIYYLVRYYGHLLSSREDVVVNSVLEMLSDLDSVTKEIQKESYTMWNARTLYSTACFRHFLKWEIAFQITQTSSKTRYSKPTLSKLKTVGRLTWRQESNRLSAFYNIKNLKHPYWLNNKDVIWGKDSEITTKWSISWCVNLYEFEIHRLYLEFLRKMFFYGGVYIECPPNADFSNKFWSPDFPPR